MAQPNRTVARGTQHGVAAPGQQFAGLAARRQRFGVGVE